jgi:predicted nucleic acid-binding protein
LKDEEDKEVLRIALASASMEERVFLVTADQDFEDINRTVLLKRYRSEYQKIEIVTPNNAFAVINNILHR